MTAKIKRFKNLILVILVVGVALLTGCGTNTGGETGLKEETGLNVSESQGVEAKATGTVKKVDSSTGKVTIASEDGSEIVLDVPSEELLANLASLVNETGAEITVDYDTNTKTVLNVHNQAETQDQATAKTSGTLKAIDTTDGTVTIVSKSGDELVFKVTDKSKILVNGVRPNLNQIADKIGSEVNVEYDAEMKTVTAIIIQD